MVDNFSHRVVATLVSLRSHISTHEENTTDAHGINLYAKLASPQFTGTVEADDVSITGDLNVNNINITGIADFSEAVITGLELLPSQTGNSGKFLYTNGTSASWEIIPQTSYSADAPVSPTLGQLWVESDVDSTTINAGSIIQYQSTAPSSPVTGSMWFDTTVNTLKVYQGSSWNPVGAQNNGYPYVYNTNGINENWTIPAGYNAMSAGPITIANGATVTIPNGSSWVVM